MKKVCHISSAHKRYDVRILERECVSLAQAGYETYLVINDNLENEIYKGVNICSTRYKFKSRLDRVFNGINAVYKEALKIDADLYHFHDPELLLIARKLKRKGKKVIFDSHEYYYEQIQNKTYIPKMIRKFIAASYYRYETSVTRVIDGVIIPTKIGGKNVFEGRTKRIAFVNNVPRMEEIPSTLNESGVREGVCYTGSLTYNRGIWHLMKAAQKAETTLILAGTFETDEFENEILNDGGQTVSYKGVLGRKEIYELYNQCAIGMSTLLNVGQYSQMGNLPTKVYEYMASGLPVILSDFPYNREMIEKYNFGLLAKPDDIDDIAAKMRYLVNNKQEAKKMGENGRKLVLEKLNWNVEEENLKALYKEVFES